MMKEDAKFSRRLERAAENFMKRKLPQEEVLFKMLMRVDDVRLLEISLRVLRACRAIGGAPDDRITARFLAAAVRVFMSPKRPNPEGPAEFLKIVERGLGADTNGALLVGHHSVINLFESVTEIIPEHEVEMAYKIVEAAVRVTKTVYFELEGRDREKADLAALQMLLAAESVRINSGSFRIPGRKVSYMDWVFQQIQEVAKSCNETCPKFTPSPEHAAVCQAYLRRRQQLPDWLVSKADEGDCLYISSYLTLGKYLLDHKQDELTIATKRYNQNSKSLKTKHRLLVKESLKFIKNVSGRVRGELKAMEEGGVKEEISSAS